MLTTLIGWFLAIIFYLKGKTNRALVYNKRTFTLLDQTTSSLNGFAATYLGSPLTTLRATKFILWNNGNTTISIDDFAEQDRLTIKTLQGGKVLESRILAVSSKTNAVKFNIDDHDGAVIEFDYLDPGQGVVVTLLHIGDDGNIEVNGTLKGGRVNKYEKPIDVQYVINVFMISALCVALAIVAGVILGISAFTAAAAYLASNVAELLIYIQLFLIALLILEKISNRKKVHNKLIEAFEEDFASEMLSQQEHALHNRRA